MDTKIDVFQGAFCGAVIGTFGGCAAAASLVAWPITLSAGAALGALSTGSALAAHQVLLKIKGVNEVARNVTLLAMEFFFTLAAALYFTPTTLVLSGCFALFTTCYSFAAVVAIRILMDMSSAKKT